MPGVSASRSGVPLWLAERDHAHSGHLTDCAQILQNAPRHFGPRTHRRHFFNTRLSRNGIESSHTLAELEVSAVRSVMASGNARSAAP
jgi:hypothetical protein